MSSTIFSALFILFLLGSSLTRIFLMKRHIRHVLCHRDTVPAAFAQTIPLTSHQRAADYTVTRTRTAIADVILGTLVTLILTLGGGLHALHSLWTATFPAGTLSHGIALLGSLMLVNWLIELPFTLYRTFSVEKRFGFNRITPGLFIRDTLKSGALAIIIGLPLLGLVLWLMNAMGTLWWLWVWAVWLGFNLLVMLIWPTWIAPLFNTFTPLEDTVLKARVETLLKRCGFSAQGLFVMDGSRRSAHGNAYFTGFGRAKRIVFFDTLLEKLAPEEVEAVLAHELGHFHHQHIRKRLLLIAPLSLALLALLGWLHGQTWFFTGLGMPESDMATTLALFFLALPAFTFPLSPLMSLWSRKHEFEADAYAAEKTQRADLVSALVKLYRDNAATLTPDPLYSACFDSHPPAALRIARLES